MAVRLVDEYVWEALFTQARTVTGIEAVLWPLDGDPDVPENLSTAKHWLMFTSLELTPLGDASRNANDSADIYRFTAQLTLITLQPEGESLYTHPGKLNAVLTAMAEAAFTGSNGKVRVESHRASRRMAAREDVNGRGLASDITLTGMVMQVVM